MTRVIVYSTALVAFLAATAMTVASIFLPTWITWSVSTADGGHFTKTIGLHRSCVSSSIPYMAQECDNYPSPDLCEHGTDRHFCSMWRSVGFMMNFAALLELVTIVAYLVVIVGGKQKREIGWRVLAFFLVLVGVLQCGAMAIVAYLFDNHDDFSIPGWKLDNSWILCTVSWSISILSAAFITLAAFVFPEEGGYELIPSERRSGRWGQ